MEGVVFLEETIVVLLEVLVQAYTLAQLVMVLDAVLFVQEEGIV